MKIPKFKLGDVVAMQSKDPEKIIQARITGADLVNNTRWYYMIEGNNLDTVEYTGAYEEDVLTLIDPV